MKRLMKIIFVILVLQLVVNQTNAQYWIGDHWYDNPLGFNPVKLHSSMGFILPAIVVGTGLLLTRADSTIKKQISIFNESGFSWGYKYPYTFMAQNNTGINIQLRKWMSVGFEFDLYVPTDQYNSTLGFAFRPFARFYPVNNCKWRLYFESGGGMVYFLENFPKPTDKDDRLGTFWNGTTKYGIGSQINFTNATAVTFGVRHLHVSNGNTKGVERNPSHDSNGFFLGFSHNIAR